MVVWDLNFIFPYIGNNDPNWLIFFRGVRNHHPDNVLPYQKQRNFITLRRRVRFQASFSRGFLNNAQVTMHSNGFCEVWTMHEWNCGEHDFGVCKCPSSERICEHVHCWSLLDVFQGCGLKWVTSGGVLFDVQVVSSDIICMYINIYIYTHTLMINICLLASSSKHSHHPYLLDADSSQLHHFQHLENVQSIFHHRFPLFSPIFPWFSTIFHHVPPLYQWISQHFPPFCHRFPPTILPLRSPLV